MNQPYESPSRLGQTSRPGAARPAMPGPLGRVLGVVAGTVLAVCALFVSVVAFAAVLVVGAVAGGWFWWKTRDIRRQLRGEMAQMQESLQRGTPFEPGSPFDRAARGPGASAGPGAGTARGPGAGRGEVLDGDFIREAPASRQDSDSRSS